MSAREKMIPAGSQTVGPFFRIGLDYLMNRAAADEERSIEIRGRVLDRDGAPVPDAMLEFWSGPAGAMKNGIPDGFRRTATDEDGNFAVRLSRGVFDARDGQAPHVLVLVFMRGLLRHLITRVYFDGAGGNEDDRVLLAVPAERRHSLIAKKDGENSYRWDVILQGDDETVFFAW